MKRLFALFTCRHSIRVALVQDHTYQRTIFYLRRTYITDSTLIILYVSLFSSANNVVGVRVRKSHINIINSVRLYRYKGGKIVVREAGGKGGGRQTPCVPSLLSLGNTCFRSEVIIFVSKSHLYSGQLSITDDFLVPQVSTIEKGINLEAKFIII